MNVRNCAIAQLQATRSNSHMNGHMMCTAMLHRIALCDAYLSQKLSPTALITITPSTTIISKRSMSGHHSSCTSLCWKVVGRVKSDNLEEETVESPIIGDASQSAADAVASSMTCSAIGALPGR
mmetsp:Transcript_71534/g.118932  ORF Transcript_71534/g.118932 Transcript_71534/m.118932 type:complete len:124 (+) Transcript_71534:173-544(+)